MKIILNDFDSKRIETLATIFQNNNAVREVLADFLNNNEKFITEEMLKEITEEYDMQPSMAFAMLLASTCGLEIHDNQLHKQIFNDYFLPSIKELSTKDFAKDKYFKTIEFPQKKFKDWEFTFSEYLPCEAFIFDDLITTSTFREYPQIGFFRENFKFPCVKQNQREWMAIKPNEILSMQTPIENAFGKVLTLGLGLGYFAFMASEKKTVESVTIVESDKNIIELFSEYILPQFPEKQKIRIINQDALAFLLNFQENTFDYVFSDIWHDESDGLPLYLKILNFSRNFKTTKFDFWIEKSMLSSLRNTVFWSLYDIFKKQKQTQNPKDEKTITTYQQFVNMLSDKELKKLKIEKN